MTAANKTNDDYVVDDNVETHKKKRRHAEKDERRAQAKQVAGKHFSNIFLIKLTCVLNFSKSLIKFIRVYSLYEHNKGIRIIEQQDGLASKFHIKFVHF